MIVLARGVTVIMTNAQITDTVLHAMEGAASGAASGVFAIVIFLVNLPLAFLIPSTLRATPRWRCRSSPRWPTSPTSPRSLVDHGVERGLGLDEPAGSPRPRW